jgi:putative ABC transport system substrate-binding protein
MDTMNKRLQLLKEVAPNASRVAYLARVSQTREPSGRPAIEPAARALGQKIIWVSADTPADFESAFAEIAKERADALLVEITPVNYAHIGSITAFAASRRMPAVYAFREGAEAGGLISFGSNLADVYRRAAGYVAKILRGAKPGDLPIEQPTTFELVINLKTAHALGITVPPALLARANEVIQ